MEVKILMLASLFSLIAAFYFVSDGRSGETDNAE